MTEAEWLECDNPERIVEFLRGKVSDRRLRLLFLACLAIRGRLKESKAFENLIEDPAGADDQPRLIITNPGVGRFYLSPLPDSPPLVTIGSTIHPDTVVGLLETMRMHQEIVACCPGIIDQVLVTNGAAVDYGASLFRVIPTYQAPENDGERHRHIELLGEVFSNPFRPVPVDPHWQTPTVVALAQCIYEERAFERLPILADALEEAGCTNADILAHCRQPSEHVRGCWVVDLLLGKT